MKYSVVVITKNEEAAIAECLLSINSDDVWIIDSESTDRTIEVANTVANIKHITKPFINYADQRNFALAQDFKYDWILMLDADERLSPNTRNFIAEQNDQNLPYNTTIISFLRRDYFLGSWLRGASGYPLHFPRLFKKGGTQVEREINEEYLTQGNMWNVNVHIDHHPMIKGIDNWYLKHLKYSTMEVEALELAHASDTARSKLKALFYKLPFRYFIMFIYLYFYKRGFLAGYPGFLYCLMRSSYEVMITAKQYEKKIHLGFMSND